jgi:hypothetical protein
MSDWSEKIADELRERRDKKAADSAKLLEKQTIKREQGPALWDRFKEAFIKNCDDLNANMKEEILIREVTPAHELGVCKRFEGRTDHLTVEFHAETGLTWDSESHFAFGHCDISVPKGRLHFFEGSSIPSSPDSLAERILRTFLLAP